MEGHHSVHSSPGDIAPGALQSRMHQKKLTPFSTPDYVKSSDFLSLRSTNVTLLKASEKHFRPLFARMGSRGTAVLICSSTGVVMDSFGDPVFLSQLASRGVYPRLITAEYSCGNNVMDLALNHEGFVQLLGSEHYLALWRKWEWAACPIISENGHIEGVCAAAVLSTDLLPSAKTILESASVAIANWMGLDESRQNLTRVHHTIISQLDYHVFFVNPNSTVLDERHPIPISELARTEMRQIASSGLTVQKEILIDNHIYAVDVRKLTDYKGDYKGTLGLFRDVSRDKRWESRLRDMEKMSTLNSLAAGIAHEIRNPLTAAKGFLQLFTERMRGSDDERFLDLTLTELDRINALVKDFMSLARPDTPTYSDMELCQVVKDLVHFVQPEAVLHNVEFDAHLPNHPIWVWGDANQIKQVLLNIVQNALQACRGRGNVDIAVEERDSQAIIRIGDTGPGMDAKQLQKLFQPFYTTKETGTGLGLSISRRIIEEHGGTISVDSSPNVGTTVIIKFDIIGKNSLEV